MNRMIGFPGSESHEQLVIDITKIIDSYIKDGALSLHMEDGGTYKITVDNPVILPTLKADIDRIRSKSES